jgi:hypothetical protein
LCVLGTCRAVRHDQVSGQLLAASAGAVIMGFAVQDPGNFFAGLALKLIVGGTLDRWRIRGASGMRRATKIRRRPAIVIVPSVVGKAINNYSEPAAPTRMVVEN